MTRISVYQLLRGKPRSTASTPLTPLTKRIFLLSFLTEFIVIYPFYVIMFGDRSQVSAAGIGVLLATWMIVSVIAEVPTGVIADKFSKKWSLVLGHIMQLATFTIWLVWPSFTGYLIGFIIWGIGEAFMSGAFQAYLYESLDAKQKQSFGKIYARSSAFTMLAYVSGSFVAFTIGPNYSLLLLLSMGVSALSLLLTISLPATHSAVHATVETELKPRVLKRALNAVASSTILQKIFVTAVIVQGLMATLGEYLPAYYNQVGTPTRWVALLISAGSLVAVLMYWWMHHLESFIARYQQMIVVGFTSLFVASFWLGPVGAVIGFFLLTRMLRLMNVHNETQIQHHAPAEARATLGSLYSFVAKILGAVLLSLIGFFAVDGKIVVPARWSVVGMIVLLLISWWYFSLKQRRTPEHIV